MLSSSLTMIMLVLLGTPHLVKDYWKKFKCPKMNVLDIAWSLTIDPMYFSDEKSITVEKW